MQNTELRVWNTGRSDLVAPESEGKGVSPLNDTQRARGTQRKKGVSRFIEVLLAEYRGLVKLNLLFCAFALPSAVVFLLGLLGYYSGVALLLSLVAAFPIGGAVVAYMFCITRMLRDEPGYIWSDFKRKFTENIMQAAVPGILCVAFVYAQVYLWGPFLFSGAHINVVWYIPGIVFLLVFGMVTPYVFLQVAYVELKTKQIIINSLILSFASAPRSFMGVAMGSSFWVAFLLLLPESLVVAPLLLLIGFSLSWLLTLMWVWPPVNLQFSIEETLNAGCDTKSPLT